ncbi:MAG: tetratricopeptide repeat protein [Proteobacteria bacterium]|nr:tetratricopeptide repeat protein [Pseudomonadota bacterium]
MSRILARFAPAVIAIAALFMQPASARADASPPTTAPADASTGTPAGDKAATDGKAGDKGGATTKDDKGGGGATTKGDAVKDKKSQAPALSAPVAATALDGYRAAYSLIYAHADYAAGIARLRALGRDDDAAVATLIGFASRKLGRYDDARAWYERALAADPAHVRTWQYYGMWHAEQGNLIKAADFLKRIEALCGGVACKEYKDLKGAIEGTVSY